MRSGTVTVILLTALLLSTPIVAIMLSDDAIADDYDSKISTDKEITFTGKVYFDITPVANQLPSAIILIADYKDGKWQYVREPCRSLRMGNSVFNRTGSWIWHCLISS